MRLESTVLTDLSANVFAALLLILLILLHAGGAPETSRPVEATADLAGRSRLPMRPGDLVDILHARRPGAPGASVDLTATRIAVRTPAASAADVPPAALGATLAGAGPLRLYVFSHRHYAAAAESLAAAGLSWEEISVPRALAAPAGGWSPGFLALLDRAADRAQFRDGLARLLAAAPGPLVPDGRVAGAGSGAGAAAAGGALPDRLLRWLGIVLAGLALAAGAATVIAVELLVPRPHGDYARGRASDAGPPHRGDPR